MALSRDEMVQRLTSSDLMDADEVAAFLANVPADQQPADGEQLARLLVKQKHLTKYQAEQIYAGKGAPLVLGNYVILDKLGQGGMGMVLKAEHKRMKRLVALKVMSPKAVKTPDALKRFHREVEAAAKLRHPNIVAADDADEAKGTHFLVMEFVNGSDLSQLIKKQGPLPVDQAVNCIVQAARGLEYAHKQGVVHRDIKPANLLIDENGTVKILDMGLARIEGATGAQAELTSTGAVMGTVDYMAPEQALSSKLADARSDIYSLGISLWYLLMGKCAYDGDSLMAKLLAHREAPIPSLHQIRHDVPESVDAIFQKMVAKQPQDRYQSMAPVIVDLEACLAATASSASLRQPVLLGDGSSFSLPLSSGTPGRSGTSVADSRAPKPTAASPPTVDSATEVTMLSGDMAEATTPQRSNSAVFPDAATRSSAPVHQHAASAWWQDRRVQIGSGVGALALVLAIVFLGPGKEDAAEKIPMTVSNVPPETSVPDRDSPSPDSNIPEPPPSKQAPPRAISPFDATQARTHQQEWADYLDTTVETTNSLGGTMILIPPGEFQMGSTDEEVAKGLKLADALNLPAEAFERSRIIEEQPQHSVTITRPFCMSATEVTVGQFREFATSTGYWTQAEQFGGGNSNTWTAPSNLKPEDVKNSWRSPGYAPSDQLPVTQVTWSDAIAFCNWLSEQELLDPCYESSGKRDWKLIPHANGYRLPTEAEWEYACRAGTSGQFSFGDDYGLIKEYAWTGESRVNAPQPVALKLPNPFGLFDLHGNAREWCYDWYSSEVYAEPAQTDPIGPDYGTDRVMRGGRWQRHAINARSAFRNDINPFQRDAQGGFRIVRAPLPQPTATEYLISRGARWSAPENLGPAINSKHRETNPFLTDDGLTLFFSTSRAGGQGSVDLCLSRRASIDEPFQPVEILPRVVNSFAADDSPCLSTDGRQLVFISNRPDSEGDFDLYLIRRADVGSKWSSPENLNVPVNSKDREDSPAFSHDGLTLFFTSNRPGGHGANDIWSAHRDSLDAPFGPPENLGAVVNSNHDETHFRPTSDGRSAILSRREPNGKTSLWLALRKTTTGPFTSLRSLPLNTEAEVTVIAPAISQDGRTLYFHSQQPGGEGDADLWLIRRLPR